MFEGKSLMFCTNKLTLYKKHKKQPVSRIKPKDKWLFHCLLFSPQYNVAFSVFSLSQFSKAANLNGFT